MIERARERERKQIEKQRGCVTDMKIRRNFNKLSISRRSSLKFFHFARLQKSEGNKKELETKSLFLENFFKGKGPNLLFFVLDASVREKESVYMFE